MFTVNKSTFENANVTVVLIPLKKPIRFLRAASNITKEIFQPNYELLLKSVRGAISLLSLKVLKHKILVILCSRLYRNLSFQSQISTYQDRSNKYNFKLAFHICWNNITGNEKKTEYDFLKFHHLLQY